MIKTTAIYFIIRLINGLISLATIYALTHLLSAKEYGLYALGMAGISLLGSILFQWLAVSISRFYAAHADKPEELLAEIFRLFIIIAAGVLATAFIFILWQPFPTITPILMISISIGSISIGLHIISLQTANSEGRPLKYGLLTFSRAALALVISVGLVKAGFGGYGAAFGVAIATMLSVVLFSPLRLTKFQVSRPDLRRALVFYGVPLSLTYLATMVLDVSDRFMIGWLLDTSSVAGYSASYDLTQQTVGAFLNVLFIVCYPRVTAAWEIGGADAARKAMHTLSRALLLGIPLVTGICIGGASDISIFFFSADIQKETAEIIPWVAIAIAINCFKCYFLDIAFQLKKATKIQLRITISMAILNVALNYVLIRYIGVLGAAISTVAAFSFGAILSWLLGKPLKIYAASARDFLSMIVVLFTVIIAIKLTPTHTLQDIYATPARLLTAITFYLISTLLLDLGSLRSFLINKFFVKKK